jgi:RNA polymerase sigma-70 factor (ECF subfamily)
MVLTDSNDPQFSFETVVLPHLDGAYNLAMWLVQNPSFAQDIVQDAIVRALTYFPSYQGGDGRAWFLRIVRNTAMTSLAARTKLSAISLDSPGGNGLDDLAALIVPDTADNPEQSFALGEARTALHRALAALPMDLRECLVLRELEDLSYRDIASITGVPLGTVMSRLSRARKVLAQTTKHLSGEGASP